MWKLRALLCSRLFRQKLNFTGKNRNSHFVPTFGDLGVTYAVHLWIVGNRVVDFLLVLIEHFCTSLTVAAQWANNGRNPRVKKGEWVTFSTNFRGHGESPTNDSWHQKTRVAGLSHGVVCVILRLAVLTQYWHVTDTHTHRQTHDDGRVQKTRFLKPNPAGFGFYWAAGFLGFSHGQMGCTKYGQT